MKSKKKILLLCPHFSEKGGVTHYNYLLKENFKSKDMSLDLYHIGKNSYEKLRFFKSFKDFLFLLRKIRNYDLIILNPSLDFKSIIRDGVYHMLSKNMHRKKTIVFFHGWNKKFADIIDRYGKRVFIKIFISDMTLVLCSDFKKKFIDWGYSPKKIKVETTTYKLEKNKAERQLKNILFISRLAKNKGALIAIQAIERLINEHNGILLNIIGDGDRLIELQKYVREKKLENNILFRGWLTGKEKEKYFLKSSILLFPTSYGEGMPITILEGMGAGLAIVTRPVAGIKDIIKNDENGYMLKTLDSKEFAKQINFLIKNEKLLKTISINNQIKAKEQYEIKNVAKRIECLYRKILFA